MTTTAACGNTGSITGLTSGGEISSWELNLLEDIPEVTSMASAGDKEFISCLKSAEGSFESYTSCGAINSYAGVELINSKATYTMDIIITALALATDVADKVVFKYSFISNGAVTIA